MNKRISHFASIILITLGGLVLLGWIGDIPLLKNGFPGSYSTMKANTALGFLLTGIALKFLQTERHNRWQKLLEKLASLLVLIGVLTVSEYIFQINLGLDQWLFKDENPSLNTVYPVRMGINTALNFLFMGIALLWSAKKTNSSIWVAQIFSSLAAIISLLSLFGHLFEVKVLATLIAYSTTQAIHTALGFLILYVGILFTNPEQGLMKVITSRLMGGFMARRLILWLILFTLILNWLVLKGYEFDWYDLRSAYGIQATFTIIFLLIIVWWNAYLLNRIERDRHLADQKLIESQQQFKQAIEAAELGTWQWDLITGKVFLSSQCEKLLGLNEGSFQGTYDAFINLLHDDDLYSLNNSLEIAKLNASRWQMEYGIMDHGQKRWILSIGKFLCNENGQATQMIGIIKDITYRKQIEDELRQLNQNLENRVIERTIELTKVNQELQEQLIIRHQIELNLQKYADEITDLYNNAPCGYHSLDSSGIFVQINDTELKWLGYTRDQVIGKIKFTDLISPQSLEIFQQNFPAFKQRGWVNNLEFDMIRTDGTILSIMLNGTAIKDDQGNFLMTRSTMFDITDRKLAELELQKTKAEAIAANLAKSIFLANMSHELRTPLNAILGFTQLLARDNSLNTYHQERLQIINRSGEHLLGLIDDILDLSKIEAGQITLSNRDCDLHLLLATVGEMLLPKAELKGLKLIFETSDSLPKYIKIDEKKLKQVLINLLNNAIKFTHKGQVILRIKQQKKAQEKRVILQFEIEDTGVGIDAEEIEHLFKIFVQTEAGKKLNQGSGLGLAISQKIVQMMGGKIQVKSNLGQGSIFNFQITVELGLDINIFALETSKQKVIGIALEQPKYRILVVEDLWENCCLLVELLTAIGFEVKAATNGLEGVKLWESWSPHLIFMDMRMPIMNGYEATKSIKEKAGKQKPIIIALTASVLEEQRETILAAGCDDFVSKPFQEAIILNKIGQYLAVQYIYENLSQIQPDLVEISKESLAIMPPEWLEQMYQAAYCLDTEIMLELIEKMPASEIALANTLKELVINFNTEIIMDLTGSLIIK
jgi:PAS domain S-box-containing protein